MQFDGQIGGVDLSEITMQKKERLKPLSLYGLDLREALHAMLSVDPRKLRSLDEKTEDHPGSKNSTMLESAKVSPSSDTTEK